MASFFCVERSPCQKFSFSKRLSAIARGLILERGTTHRWNLMGSVEHFQSKESTQTTINLLKFL